MAHDINDLRLNSLQPLQLQIDSTTTANATYIGKALPGITTSEPSWKIGKIDTTTGTVMQWADNGQFSQVWDDRASLTYQ